MNSNKRYQKIKKIPIRYIFIMAVAVFSINVLGLALPLTMKRIYGSIIVSKSTDQLIFVLAIVFIAIALEALMRRMREVTSKWIAAKYEYHMSTLLIGKLFNVHHSDEKNNYITNLEKIKSIRQIAAYYSIAYYQLFIDIPFMAIYLYLIYFFGGVLVIVPVIFALVYLVIVIISMQIYSKKKVTYIHSNDQLLGVLTESLEKIHFIKSAGIEETQINTYKKILEETTNSEYLSNRNQSFPKIFASKISQVTFFLTLIGGGYLINIDMLTFPELTACAMLGGRAVTPIVSLMNVYQRRTEIKILNSRIDEVVMEKDQYDENTPIFPEDISGVIELKALMYENIHSKLNQRIDLRIKTGDFVVIEPTEFPSYKSVMNKICGYETITEGNILIDSMDINEWNMNTLKGKIEYLSEEVSLFKGSVLENITYFDKTKIDNAFQAAGLTGLDQMVGKMPEGFASQIDSHMVNYLSSGFLQRLNLSRALLEMPRIIVFDRIDENMDIETFNMYYWLLSKLKGKSTIIVSTWNKDILALGDYHMSPEIEE